MTLHIMKQLHIVPFEYSNQLNIRKTIVPLCTTTTNQYLGNLARGLTNKLVVELGSRAVGWAG